jgi:peptidoglycan-N-acetylglucosamine deacetylase
VPVVHPFATGRLARWRVWHGFLETVVARGDVWFAPMEAIAAHVDGLIAAGRYAPRIDRLPYYQSPVSVR